MSETALAAACDIAGMITEALGGRAEVDSTLDEGSTFTVTLPLAGPPVNEVGRGGQDGH